MFQQRLRPLEFLERRVVAVRYSMNEPIVSTAELPPGPARAAIVVYLEEQVRRVVVVIRSLSRERVVQYEMRGEEYAEATRMAFDAGLSFAESMGFLFDDEQLANKAGEDRAAGLKPLRELLHLASSLRPAIAFEEELRIEADPLRGEDLDLEMDLTKFRDRKAAAAGATIDTDVEGAVAITGATLGRVQPIRKLAVEPPALPPTLHLLASF